MGIVQTALIPAAGFIIGYHAYKSLNYWGWLGLGTIASVGLVLAFTEESPNFRAEDVDNALITGSVEGDPAMFLFTKGQTDQTGFTTGRIMVDDDIEDIHDVAVQINEDVGEDRIEKGFKSWKRNVWGLKPYAAEEYDAESDDYEFYIARVEPPAIECECGNMMDIHAFEVIHGGETKILCQSCIEPIIEEFLDRYGGREELHDAEDTVGNQIFHTGCGVCGSSCSNCERDLFCWDTGDEDGEGGNLCCPCSPRPCPTGTDHGPGTFRNREEFEAPTGEWKLNMKRLNPLSRHYIPKKKEVADAESFNADYCSTCVVRDHPSCPLEEGCRCCDNTMMGIYRDKSYGAESFEAESYREFMEEIEKLMNETAGGAWDVYAETIDGIVEVTIEWEPLDPKFFDDIGEDSKYVESIPLKFHKDAEHTTSRNCSLCGQPFTGYGNNPEPVVPMSQGQCCDTCNTTIVIPARMRGMGFRAETAVQKRAKSRGLIARLEKSEKKEHYTKPTGYGVKKNFWRGLFSFKKQAETFEAPEGVCLFCDETEDLETVNLDGWPEEICEHCLDPTNWMDAETGTYFTDAEGMKLCKKCDGYIRSVRSDEVARSRGWAIIEKCCRCHETDAERDFHEKHMHLYLKGKVRTMSGKPHKTRKLVKDKDITAEEAATRLKLESPNDAYGLAYNQGFDDARIAKRWSSTGTKKMTYSPDDSYKEDEKLFEDTYRRRE